MTFARDASQSGPAATIGALGLPLSLARNCTTWPFDEWPTSGQQGERDHHLAGLVGTRRLDEGINKQTRSTRSLRVTGRIRHPSLDAPPRFFPPGGDVLDRSNPAKQRSSTSVTENHAPPAQPFKFPCTALGLGCDDYPILNRGASYLFDIREIGIEESRDDPGPRKHAVPPSLSTFRLEQSPPKPHARPETK